jgi:sterol desaturase/sphingolipid hydroxylase (fatty acid hydroxylase superfamily)
MTISSIDPSYRPGSSKSRLGNLVSYGLYPLLLAATLSLYTAALMLRWDLAKVFVWMASARMVLLLAVEYLYPAKAEWKMTWASFRRDLKYMVVNGGVVGLLKLGAGWLALDWSRLNTGLVANTSIALEFLALVLVFEFFQYWYHRLSHEGEGHWGLWLWKVHVAHHLPDKVYLLMHPVGHPLNLLISLALVQLPLVVLGARPESIFLFNALMGLQGLVSHFNVNVQAGPLNYLLVGTELHRCHHSADLHEAKNYGVLTPFWDLVFGTFVYRPRQLPRNLGVSQPDLYPPSDAVGQVLALPFKRSSPVGADPCASK